MLTSSETAFCRAYARNGGNGSAAYGEGHPNSSPKASKTAASRLMARQEIRDEIAKIRKEAGAVVQITSGGGGKGGKPPLNGDAYGPDEPLPRSPAETPEAVELTRPWIVETLIRNARMCMGDLDVPVSKMVKRTVDSGNGVIREEIVAETIYVRERDAPAANTALKLLSEQLEIMKTEAAGTSKPGAYQISEAAQLQLDRIAAAMGGPRHEPAANAA